MTSSTKPANFYADFGSLATLKGAAKNQDPKALREAARQFESLFTQMMLKSMRQASSTGENGLMDSDQSNFYRDMFDNQMAVQLAKGKGLGLADMLVRQLSQGTVDPSADKATASKLKALTMPSRPSAMDVAALEKAIVTATPSLTSASKTTEVKPAASDAEIRKILKAMFGGGNSVESASDEHAPNSKETQPSDTSNAKSTEIDQGAAVKAQPQALATSRDEFIKQLWPHAQAAARELGVDAKTLIAHAALETGWGKYVPCNPDGTCSFNLFGIKATGQWKGDAVAVNTLEFENGVAVKRSASFRAYESPAESFRDYAALIKNNPRYASAVGTGHNAAAFASALQQGGYATDPNYAAKLAAVADKLNATLKVNATQPLAFGRSGTAGKISGEAT